MKVKIHQTVSSRIAEVVSEEVLLNNPEDGLQLLVDLYYQDFDKMILHQKNIAKDFFDLKSGLAGAVLQKFSNYRMRLAIIGDFSIYPGESIRDFIYESNKGKQINFLPSVEQAVEKLAV